MATLPPLKIDISEQFEHLPCAPIVEAVIEIRARATTTWQEQTVRSELKTKLVGYSLLDSLKAVRGEFKLEPGKSPSSVLRDLGWSGDRFQSADKKQIARFSADRFAFSRLGPYQDWAQFSTEALRFWAVFRELAVPQEIGRIGLRFINRILLLSSETQFDHYIKPAPNVPGGLPLSFAGFLQHDILETPGHPYAINVIRTLQRTMQKEGEGRSIILDIDAFTTDKPNLQDNTVSQRLAELRWLKNKIFFSSITDEALRIFQGGST